MTTVLSREMPLAGSQGGKRLAVHVVAGDLVIQVGVPVDLDRARDVAGFVEQDVFVGLDHHQLAVGDGAVGNGRGEPLSGHKAFRVRIRGELFVLFNGVGHGDGLSLTTVRSQAAEGSAGAGRACSNTNHGPAGMLPVRSHGEIWAWSRRGTAGVAPGAGNAGILAGDTKTSRNGPPWYRSNSSLPAHRRSPWRNSSRVSTRRRGSARYRSTATGRTRRSPARPTP